MSGTSSVGQGSVYEAGDQRNSKDSEINERERYKEGKEGSHKANDSSMHSHDHPTWYIHVNYIRLTEDQRSIANKLAREEKVRRLFPNERLTINSCSSVSASQSRRKKKFRSFRKIPHFLYVKTACPLPPMQLGKM